MVSSNSRSLWNLETTPRSPAISSFFRERTDGYRILRQNKCTAQIIVKLSFCRFILQFFFLHSIRCLFPRDQHNLSSLLDHTEIFSWYILYIAHPFIQLCEVGPPYYWESSTPDLLDCVCVCTYVCMCVCAFRNPPVFRLFSIIIALCIYDIGEISIPHFFYEKKKKKKENH